MKTTKELRSKVQADIARGLSHRQIQANRKIGLATISRIRNKYTLFPKTTSIDTVEIGATIDPVPTEARLTSIGIVGNDAQVPYHDPVAIELFLDFCKREQPDWIDLNGDWLDFYQISTFDKDPLRKAKLQDDITILVEILERIRADNPKATIYYEMGNHEKRLKKYLWKHEEIACLDCLRLESLLHFNELGIILVEKWRQQGDLYIMHGTVLSKHAGYSAKLHFEKYGATMIHGHSHRDGKFTRRTLSGHKAVWENYCLCKLDDVEYDPFPNWTQGFSKVTMIGKRPYVEQVPIITGEYIYGGKRYK